MEKRIIMDKICRCIASILVLSLVFVPSIGVVAVEDDSSWFANGVAPVDYEIVQEHKASLLDGSGMARSLSNPFPAEVDLSENLAFPYIGDQGTVNSCVAYAIVYYQYTYEVNSSKNLSSKVDSNVYSPSWPYYALIDMNDVDSGVEFTEVYKFLSEHGALKITEDQYNLSFQISKEWPANTSAMRTALSERLYNWNSIEVSKEGTVITSNQDEDLDEIKAALNYGKLLTVGTPATYDFTNYDSNLNDPNKDELILYGCNDVDTGHFITIVGYNDNITYDINGNGTIEDGEKGAFKVANSWGPEWGNSGFCWIMYDALNEVSSVPGNWDNQSTRYPAFAAKYHRNETREETIIGDNLFTYIYTEEKTPLFIAEINLNPHNSVYTQISLLGKKQSESIVSEYLTTYSGNMRPYLAQTTTLLFDYEELITSFDYNRTSMYWGVKVDHDNGGLNSIASSIKLTDSLGNTIKTMSQENDNFENFSCNLTLQYGDVNYDGVLTTADSSAIMSYITKSITFSNTQKLLADYNRDGKISILDVSSINNAIS